MKCAHISQKKKLANFVPSLKFDPKELTMKEATSPSVFLDTAMPPHVAVINHTISGWSIN